MTDSRQSPPLQALDAWWGRRRPWPLRPAMTLSHGVLLLLSCAPLRSKRRENSFSERNEQQQQRDQQRENAERFGHGEAEDQVAELALSGRRVTNGRGEVVAEDHAHADAR